MDLTAAPAALPAVSFAGGDNLHHRYCCGEMVLCGRDITGDTDCTGGCTSPPCPACAHAEEAGLPCPDPECPWRGSAAAAN